MSLDIPEPTYKIVEREFSCAHPTTETRCKVDRLGRDMFLKQCQVCGQAASSAIAHSKVEHKGSVLAFDYDAEQAWRDKRDSRYKDLVYSRYIDKRVEHTTAYYEYLQGQKWHAKRYRVLSRDGYKCQACLERKATQVHHLTYDRIFNEPLFDLVSVCKDCHAEIHDKEGTWTT